VTLEHLAARKLELAEPFHPATIGRPPDTGFLASASKIHQRSRASASVSTTEGRRRSQLNGWSWPGAVMTTSPPLVVNKRVDDADNPGQKRNQKILLGREFYVFNAEQCEGLPERFYPQEGAAPVDEIPTPQAVLDSYLARPVPRRA
jgi:hypothetical protein